MGWSSLPPEHKKAFFRGVAAYALAVALTAGFVWFRSSATLEDWNARIPYAAAPITQNGLAAPDDAAASFSNTNTVPAPNSLAGDIEIGMVMTDLGISESKTALAINHLPPEIALGFSPYAPNLAQALKQGRSAGHETLILIPMEPLTYPKDDPGPKALLTRLSDAENARQLDAVLSQAGSTVGAMNFMGSALLQDQKNVTAVMTALQKQSRFFVENPQGPESIAEDIAAGTGTPFLEGDVVIDSTVSDLALRQQLLKLETIARKNGYAVGIAQPYPLTFTILKDWADSLARRGFKLVPVSALLKAKVQHGQASQKTAPTTAEPTVQPDEQPPPLP